MFHTRARVLGVSLLSQSLRPRRENYLAPWMQYDATLSPMPQTSPNLANQKGAHGRWATVTSGFEALKVQHDKFGRRRNAAAHEETKTKTRHALNQVQCVISFCAQSSEAKSVPPTAKDKCKFPGIKEVDGSLEPEQREP